MKKIKWLSLVLFSVLMLGCYEVNEEIVISDNGSGSFSTKMDLGQLVEMMQSFGAQEMNQEGLDKIIDTVISMRSFTDSAKDLSPEQKELYSNGKMRMQMNIKEKIFKIDTDIKFKNYDELQLLLAGGGSMSALGDAMKKVFDKGGDEQQKQDMPDSPKDPDLGKATNIYDVVIKDGSITKKLNKEKYNALMDKPEMAEMKQASTMGMEVLYTTTIKLPRPVKTSTSPLIKLSDDKKTVTIKYNYLSMFEAPEKLEYSITY